MTFSSQKIKQKRFCLEDQKQQVDEKVAELLNRFPKMMVDLKNEVQMTPLAGLILLQETFKNKDDLEKHYRVKFELQALKNVLQAGVARLDELEKEFSNSPV
jgi:hypothetical protein